MITLFFAGEFTVRLFVNSDEEEPTPEGFFRLTTTKSLVEFYECNPEYIEVLHVYNELKEGPGGFTFFVWLQDKINENPRYPIPHDIFVHSESPEAMREVDKLIISIAKMKKENEKG